MPTSEKKSWYITSIAYWFLLLYIIAALVWWFLSLVNQSNAMAGYRADQLRYTVDSVQHRAAYDSQLQRINEEKRRDATKYTAEGITFMFVIFIGAFFVYRSVRKQVRMQQQQQNFMMAVTHELKTPIAVARLNLETMQKHQLDVQKQQKLIQMTLQETMRLHSLTSNILVSSQLEAGKYQQTVEDLDLSQLTISSVEDFKQRFADRPWEMEITPDIAIEGDPLLLQIMVNNLLENAHKYSNRGTPVKVVLKRTGSKATLQVIDEGIGIADGEKKKIFDKFYRIGNEETRKTKGTGLGLHLCRKIAKDHRAEINVTNNLPSGSIFTITFHRIG